MTTFTRLCFAFVLFFNSATFGGQPKPQNFIVVLDLSDRLLNENQAERDKALVLTVFAKFENLVKSRMYINSKDRFRVSIAPQAGGVNTQKYEDKMDIFMDMIHFSKKRIDFEAFRKELPKILNELYIEAMKRKTKPKDFNGVDIWKYFNDKLKSDMATSMDNQLVLITDGYLDFESNRFVGIVANRRTDSGMLKKFRNDTNWKLNLMAESEGLIKLEYPHKNLKIIVLEIKPKTQNLNELGLLLTLWGKWMKENNIPIQLEPANTLDHTKMKIVAF